MRMDALRRRSSRARESRRPPSTVDRRSTVDARLRSRRRWTERNRRRRLTSSSLRRRRALLERRTAPCSPHPPSSDVRPRASSRDAVFTRVDPRSGARTNRCARKTRERDGARRGLLGSNDRTIDRSMTTTAREGARDDGDD